MITLTESLKKRFCKDQNLPIKVYSEPIFTERLKLFDAYEKYLEFCSMFRIRFNSDEQAYLAYYNDLKDRIINYIKESEAFQSLNKADMYKEFNSQYMEKAYQRGILIKIIISAKVFFLLI